jgi:hypothetical protein
VHQYSGWKIFVFVPIVGKTGATSGPNDWCQITFGLLKHWIFQNKYIFISHIGDLCRFNGGFLMSVPQIWRTSQNRLGIMLILCQKNGIQSIIAIVLFSEHALFVVCCGFFTI